MNSITGNKAMATKNRQLRRCFFCAFYLFCAYIAFAACGTPNLSSSNGNASTSNENLSVTAVGLEAAEPAPQLGVVINQDGIIVDIEPQNSAAQAGLKKGDKLIRVGELTVQEDPANIRLFLQVVKVGDTISVEIDDQGEIKVIQVLLVQHTSTQNTTQTDRPIPTATPVVLPFNYF